MGREWDVDRSNRCSVPKRSYTIASPHAAADLMSSAWGASTRRTSCEAGSYENRVVGPSRSDRKNTRSPTHIGLKSLESVRGTLVIDESDRSAIQIGEAVPPR